MLAQDLRCLDAHAHLGNLELDRRAQQAARHYEMGMTIGVLSLQGARFNLAATLAGRTWEEMEEAGQ